VGTSHQPPLSNFASATEDSPNPDNNGFSLRSTSTKAPTTTTAAAVAATTTITTNPHRSYLSSLPYTYSSTSTVAMTAPPPWRAVGTFAVEFRAERGGSLIVKIGSSGSFTAVDARRTLGGSRPASNFSTVSIFPQPFFSDRSSLMWLLGEGPDIPATDEHTANHLSRPIKTVRRPHLRGCFAGGQEGCGSGA
jgi:hypothetical protein